MMLRRWHLVFLFFSISMLCVRSQTSDLYLVDLLKVAGKYEVQHPRYLSKFNRNGYNNQPYFIDSHTLLATVAPKTEPLNTDIYQLDLRSNRATRLTHTADREYSPTPAKNLPGHVNCVIVEVENQDNQILWQYPLDRSGGGQPLLHQVKDVGYFCEMRNNWIAIFEVGSPNKLWLVHRETGEKKFISSNIGRSLHLLRSGHLVYVHKFSDDYWFLKKMNPDNFTIEIIKKTLPESEDFTILADDSILMGQGSKLFLLDHANDLQWHEIVDLERAGISNINRMAFNGIDKLVIVDQK